MGLQDYWLFVCASIILCVVPGPDMIYLLGRTITQGKKAGLVAAIGINLGAYFHLLAAILGISAIIATSSTAFTILKWCGALYLIYLGIQVIRSNQATVINVNGRIKKPALSKIFWQGFLSDALNPKVAIFFLSLLPQFIHPAQGNDLMQLLILGITLNVIAISINMLLVFFSHVLTRQMERSNRATFLLNKAMGTVFVALGLRLANEQQQ